VNFVSFSFDYVPIFYRFRAITTYWYIDTAVNGQRWTVPSRRTPAEFCRDIL